MENKVYLQDEVTLEDLADHHWDLYFATCYFIFNAGGSLRLGQNCFCIMEPHLFLRFIICIFSNLEESSVQ